MPNRLVDGLRKRYAGIEGNPEEATSGANSATSGPDPENNTGSPTYPAWGPPTDEAPAHFTSTRQIPYRGAEPHGVAFTPQTHPDPVLEETPGIAGQIPVPIPEGLPDVEPVPVRIVETAPDPAERRRFVASYLTIPVSRAGEAFRILGYRQNRTKARIFVKNIALASAQSVGYLGLASGAGGSVSLPAGVALNQILISAAGAAAAGYEQLTLSGILGGPLTIGYRYTTGGGETQLAYSPGLQPAPGQQITLTVPVVAGTPQMDINLYGTGVTGGRLWISSDESPNANAGFPIDSSDGFPWESNTTEDVWASLDASSSNGLQVTIYEEFVTDVLPERKRNG